jgi:hypothetical protein
MTCNPPDFRIAGRDLDLHSASEDDGELPNANAESEHDQEGDDEREEDGEDEDDDDERMISKTFAYFNSQPDTRKQENRKEDSATGK